MVGGTKLTFIRIISRSTHFNRLVSEGKNNEKKTLYLSTWQVWNDRRRPARGRRPGAAEGDGPPTRLPASTCYPTGTSWRSEHRAKEDLSWCGREPNIHWLILCLFTSSHVTCRLEDEGNHDVNAECDSCMTLLAMLTRETKIAIFLFNTDMNKLF